MAVPVQLQSNAIYIIQTEIVQLLTVLKKSLKAQAHTDDGQVPLLNSLYQLRDVLDTTGAIHQIDIGTILTPFLDCIRSGETTGPVTAQALSSVNKFLLYGFIDPNIYEVKLVSAAASNISNAVNHARFVGVDPATDEVVLLKILQVVRTLLFVNASFLLSDDDVCECLQTCFRIIFEARLSELLRKCAENILMEVTFMLFSRLAVFKDSDVRVDTRRLRMLSSLLDVTQKGTKKKRIQKGTVLSSAKLSAAAKNPVTTSSISLAEPSTQSVAPLTQLTTVASSPDLTSPDYVMVTQSDLPTTPANTTATGLADSVNGSDAVSSSGVVLDTESPSQTTLTDVTTTATPEVPPPEPYSLNPYGISTVHDLLRFLVEIINPLDKNCPPMMQQLGLSLLTVAFEISGDLIANFPSLIAIVREELLHNLMLHFSCEPKFPVFVSGLRLGFLIFESCRTFLKFQLELYLTKLLQMASSERVLFEWRDATLQAIIDLWRLPGFIAELYVNYDCSPHCSNILEESTKILSKNAFPIHGLFNSNLLSLEALLAIVDCIEEHCLSRMLTTSKYPIGNNSTERLTEESVASMQSVPTIYRNTCFAPKIRTSGRMPSVADLLQTKGRKGLLQMAVDEFNKKPSKGLLFLQEHKLISSQSPQEIASFLKNQQGVDKKVIGEYIGDRRNPAVLKAYVEQMNVEGLRIDEALRCFLESFRLPGEAPVIGIIMEQFAATYFAACGSAFEIANSDAAFTLSYAVIMLNTDQHNNNVRKQSNPMTIEDFKKNVKGCNGGNNFSESMLNEIFTAVHNEEIVMPEEQSGLVKDKYLWKISLVSAADKTKNEYIHVQPLGLFDKEVFSMSWRHIVSALSYVYDKTIGNSAIQKALSGFRKCALISAHYSLFDVFDNIIITLCKFTTLQSLSPNLAQSSTGASSPVAALESTPELVAVQLGLSLKAMNATKTVFTLAHRYGDVLREGWRNLLDVMHRLHVGQLLPPELEEVEDFVSETGRISIARRQEASADTTTSGGVFTSFYHYFSGSSSADPQALLSPEEREAINQARACITECHLELILQDTKFLRLESLQELTKAIARAMMDQEASTRHRNQQPMTSQSQQLMLQDFQGSTDDVFYLELLVRVVIQNRDRIVTIWPMVRDCLFTCILRSPGLSGSSSQNSMLDEPCCDAVPSSAKTNGTAAASGAPPAFVVQRAVVGLLRLAVRLMRREEVGHYVVQSLRMLQLLSLSARRHVAEQVSFGLFDLVQSNSAVATQLPTETWRLVFQLLQVFGAGVDPLPEWTHEFLSELEADPAFAPLLSSIPIIPRVPSPVQAPPQSPPPQPQPTAVVGFLPSSNQFAISVDAKLSFHCPRAFFQCVEALTFLIRDGSTVTLQNAGAAVWCLRTFIEAAINGAELAAAHMASSRATGPASSRQSKQAWRAATSLRNSASGGNQAQAANSTTTAGSIDSDDESDQVASAYQAVALQLLDLVNALHSRVCRIYSAASEAVPATTVPQHKNVLLEHMWNECWCPLLQATARLCCDRRRQVRAQALTYLQRSLLHPDLHMLTSQHWEHAFNAILFPLLASLLQAGRVQLPAGHLPYSRQQLAGLEEARVRACAQILPKVFLQHLASLYKLTTFTALWLTILDFMDCYYKLGVDPLSEAIAESLKNILLVMETSGVLQLGSDSSQLLKLTWDRLQLFLPSLKSELEIRVNAALAKPSETAPDVPAEGAPSVESTGPVQDMQGQDKGDIPAPVNADENNESNVPPSS